MESNSSHTYGSESESDRDCSDSSCSDDEDPEAWYEDVDDLLEDVANDEPLSEPSRHRSSSTQTLIILLQWFVYFLLFGQATCKISDNGLEWLLYFMFQFLHVKGINYSSEYLSQLALMLPSSLYLLRKFVNLERDNFVKFAVCPKCASLFWRSDCFKYL